MADLNALFLNCSLKKADEKSNTDVMLNDFIRIFDGRQIKSEVIRVADYNVAYGISPDMGEGDEWPQIFEKVKAADIVILGSPVWLGELSSISKKVLERLNGASDQTNDKNQAIYYDKVAGVAVTGNEDGAKRVASDLLFGLVSLGFTLPPNPYAYWVGDAGPGPSYVEAEGYKSEFTQSGIQMAANNIAIFAEMLKNHPIPPEGNTM